MTYIKKEIDPEELNPWGVSFEREDIIITETTRTLIDVIKDPVAALLPIGVLTISAKILREKLAPMTDEEMVYLGFCIQNGYTAIKQQALRPLNVFRPGFRQKKKK